MKRFIGLIQFMTRLPMPIDVGIDEEFHKSSIYFPWVGLILGLFYYGMAQIGLWWLDSFIGAVLVVIGTVILTGGLHLDGLGDSFDGLFSYRSKEKILEIMKDSRLGTNGMLAILLVLLLKVGLVKNLLEFGQLWPLIIMPIVGRTMEMVACYKTVTPRQQGMGNIFIGKVSTSYLIGILLITFALTEYIVYINNSLFIEPLIKQGISLLLILIACRLFVLYVYKKIDGITGDILGCICELGELGYLALVFWVL